MVTDQSPDHPSASGAAATPAISTGSRYRAKTTLTKGPPTATKRRTGPPHADRNVVDGASGCDHGWVTLHASDGATPKGPRHERIVLRMPPNVDIPEDVDLLKFALCFIAVQPSSPRSSEMQFALRFRSLRVEPCAGSASFNSIGARRHAGERVPLGSVPCA